MQQIETWSNKLKTQNVIEWGQGEGGGPEQANVIEKEILEKSSNEGVPVLAFSFRRLNLHGVCLWGREVLFV